MIREEINFRERVIAFEQIIKKQSSQLTFLSWVRLAFFITLIGAMILFIQQLNSWSFVSMFAFLIAFVVSIKRYNSFAFKRKQSKFLKQINHQNLLRKDLSLNTFDKGEKFIDQWHSFSGDLDIFGKHSLWQLVWRGSTDMGRNTLAKWLTIFENKQAVQKRQSAVKEIASLVDWSQEFEAFGKHRKIPSRKQHQFFQWIMNYHPLESKKQTINLALSIALIIINSALLITAILGVLPFFFIGISLVVSFVFLSQYIKMIARVNTHIDNGGKILNIYLLLLKSIVEQNKKKPFKSPFLQDLMRNITTNTNDSDAISAIHHLKKIITRIDQRSNIIYWIINPVLILDYWLARCLDNWIKKHQSHIKVWIDTVGVFEALNSMGGHTYTFEKTIFPEINVENSDSSNTNNKDESNGQYYIKSKAMGHCLIPEDKRINNDFELKGKGSINLITGSNMSGKSTFLRTIGVNLVLAQSGMPVSAAEFCFSPIDVFTSMRTTDNLEESTSSFYAELQRIRQLIHQIRQEKPVLFMLDELLKGTNSNDRHQGAKHLILQLKDKNVMGLISTHDLALSTEPDLQKIIENFSFNSTFEGEKINFDYQLVKGPCNSFNASVLMKNMGIEIP